jgi:hypothetical protein
MFSSTRLTNTQQLNESLIHCWGFVRTISNIIVVPANKADEKETWYPGDV